MEQPSTVVFSGGGTGGHLFPGIAVAAELQSQHPELGIVFAGSARDIERDIVTAQGYVHWTLPVEPSTSFHRRPHRVAWNMWHSYVAAGKLVRERRPVCIVGLGGFASVPVALAGRRMRIPLVLLEQNIVPGRATRLLSRFAASICTSFEETSRDLARGANICVTGNPVRREIAELTRGRFKTPIPSREGPGEGGNTQTFHPSPARLSSPKSNLSPEEERGFEMRRNSRSTFERGAGVTLLVLGGSQGAVAINDAVLASIAQWKEQFPACRIIHQTGHADIHRVRKSYEQHKQNAVVEAFFPEMSGLYREADVVVSRAGATTLAELACAGCPAILIPYPRSVGDHQLANARWFARKGAAMVVEQAAGPTVTSATLAESLSRLLAEPARRDAMRDAMAALARPDAARDVVACIEPYIR